MLGQDARETALEVARLFLKRPWFGIRTGTLDAQTFATLLFEIYRYYSHGDLLSKKDAQRAMNVDHVATALKYINLACDEGIIAIEKSGIDARVDLLVPTQVGIECVERELRRLLTDIQWAQARLEGKTFRAEKLRPDLPPEFRPIAMTELVKATSSIEGYQETLKHAPTNESARRAIAFWHKWDGRWREAKKEYEYLLEHFEREPNALESLSRCNFMLGNLDVALDQINEAIKMLTAIAGKETLRDPWKVGLADFHWLHGQILDAMNDHRRAQREYRKALEYDPSIKERSADPKYRT
ncbi:MAG: tetratricopeptide repeat protein [Minisyncoccia bacterium]